MPDVDKISFASFTDLDKIVYTTQGSFVVGTKAGGSSYQYDKVLTNPLGVKCLGMGLFSIDGGVWFGDLAYPLFSTFGIDTTSPQDIMTVVTDSNIIIRVGGPYGPSTGQTVEYQVALMWAGL